MQNQLNAVRADRGPGSGRFLAMGGLYSAVLSTDGLLLEGPDGALRWRLEHSADEVRLLHASGPLSEAALLAALETVFALLPATSLIHTHAPAALCLPLIADGAVEAAPAQNSTGDEIRIVAAADMFWQYAPLWLAQPARQPFPVRQLICDGKRHPQRPAKPKGIVYQRFIPWLDQMLSFRSVDIERDLMNFNRWMNDPVVAEFWQEEGTPEQHRAYLSKLAADPHTVTLLACLDDVPFGYFEVYWAKEDRISPYYDADDFDRGWHVLIGEAAYRGKPFVTAWLASISHYIFLDDCRTRRIPIEPRADNRKMIRNLGLGGYANLKEFDFPHKRAMLGMLLRERFFSEKLWMPRDDSAATGLSASLA